MGISANCCGPVVCSPCLYCVEDGERMNHTFYARGAYGRAPAVEDWESGKDFQCLSTFRYFSNRDVAYLRGQGYLEIAFLDKNARRVFTVRLNNA